MCRIPSLCYYVNKISLATISEALFLTLFIRLGKVQ